MKMIREDIKKLFKRTRKIEKCLCADTGCCYVELTYAEASTAVANSTLVPNTLYKITDRGDRGIFLTAVSENKFNPEGTRIMLVTHGYTYASRNAMYYGLNTYQIGDKVLWNGHIWENTTGNNTEAPYDGALDWVLIPKTNFTDEYVEKEFGIIYDFDLDHISLQWDEYNNFIGHDYALSTYTYGAKLIEYTDWGLFDYVNKLNYENGIQEAYCVSNNRAHGIFNNYINSDDYLDYKISNNVCLNGKISGNIFINIGSSTLGVQNNIVVDGIVGNTCNGITYNTCDYIYSNILPIDNSNSLIEHNSNKGAILNNYCDYIGYNTNTGDNFGLLGNIEGNGTSEFPIGDIAYNSNSGPIAYNSTDGTPKDIISNSNAGRIYLNSNTGHIRANTCAGKISENSNTGVITENSGSDGIEQNSNSGNIFYNKCSGIWNNENDGGIVYNTTNEDISSNTNSGDIFYNYCHSQILANSNSGDIIGNYAFSIMDNTNTGNIQYNAISGFITSNANLGDIERNMNNGNITSITSSPNVCNIKNNVNNGNISGAQVADVTDIIVNK